MRRLLGLFATTVRFGGRTPVRPHDTNPWKGYTQTRMRRSKRTAAVSCLCKPVGCLNCRSGTGQNTVLVHQRLKMIQNVQSRLTQYQVGEKPNGVWNTKLACGSAINRFQRKH